MNVKPFTSESAWDKGELGRDEDFVEVVRESPEMTKALDDALELQLISVRLQKSLIDGLKLIAKANGIGYQPLMRQVLNRFVDSELRRLVRSGVATSEGNGDERPPSRGGPTQEKRSRKLA